MGGGDLLPTAPPPEPSEHRQGREPVRPASEVAPRPPRAGKLARIVIGSFVTHDLGPRPSGESGQIIACDDRPPYLLTLRTESGSGPIKVAKAHCTPSKAPVNNAAAADAADAADTAPAPLALACDLCHKWLSADAMVHTTYGTAHAEQGGGDLDFCSPCIESPPAAGAPPRPPLTLMTVTARVEAARAAAVQSAESAEAAAAELAEPSYGKRGGVPQPSTARAGQRRAASSTPPRARPPLERNGKNRRRDPYKDKAWHE